MENSFCSGALRTEIKGPSCSSNYRKSLVCVLQTIGSLLSLCRPNWRITKTAPLHCGPVALRAAPVKTMFCSINSILFCSRLSPSTSGSSPPPESSYLLFLCYLLHSVAQYCHLFTKVLVFQLILRPLSATLCL